MKNVKKSLLSGLGFLMAVGGVFAINTGGDAIWRVTSGGNMQDITNECTYNAPPETPKCASVLLSFTANGDYFEDPNKVVRVSSDNVFRITE